MRLNRVIYAAFAASVVVGCDMKEAANEVKQATDVASGAVKEASEKFVEGTALISEGLKGIDPGGINKLLDENEALRSNLEELMQKLHQDKVLGKLSVSTANDAKFRVVSVTGTVGLRVWLQEASDDRVFDDRTAEPILKSVRTTGIPLNIVIPSATATVEGMKVTCGYEKGEYKGENNRDVKRGDCANSFVSASIDDAQSKITAAIAAYKADIEDALRSPQTFDLGLSSSFGGEVDVFVAAKPFTTDWSVTYEIAETSLASEQAPRILAQGALSNHELNVPLKTWSEPQYFRTYSISALSLNYQD